MKLSCYTPETIAAYAGLKVGNVLTRRDLLRYHDLVLQCWATGASLIDLLDPDKDRELIEMYHRIVEEETKIGQELENYFNGRC